MARKKEKASGKPKRHSRWLPLVSAYGFAILCVAVGVAVLVYGGVDPRAEEGVDAGGPLVLGIGMVALGALAGGLTAFLQWNANRRK
jgi:hypothetical protein